MGIGVASTAWQLGENTGVYTVVLGDPFQSDRDARTVQLLPLQVMALHAASPSPKHLTFASARVKLLLTAPRMLRAYVPRDSVLVCDSHVQAAPANQCCR